MNTDFMMELLRCQDCSAPLRERGAGWECTGCRSSGDIDAAGILHLELPEDALGSPSIDVGLGPGTSRAEAPSRISEAISAASSGTAGYWDYLSSFLPNPAGFAVLGAVHRGTRSLVLSSGWGNLPRVISSLGGQVVAMDSLHEGLVYTSLQESQGSLGCVFSSLRLPLPFADDAFESVFLDDLATGTPDAVGEHHGGVQGGRTGKEGLLRECFRVLRPGGHLVLLTWNRMSPLPHAPSPDLGRRPAATKPACATKPGFSGLLRRSGFEEPRCFVPWPEHGTWHCLVEESDLDGAQLTLGGTSWKKRFAQLALDLSVQLGIAGHLVPGHFFVARVPDRPTGASVHPPASTLEVIARAVEVDPDDIRRLDSHANSNCLSFRTERLFVKIPLTREAAERIANASRVLGDAPAAMAEDTFIVAPRPGVEAQGIPLGVYPLVPHENPNGEWSDKVERVSHALGRLNVDRRDRPLGQTDFWRRLTAAPSHADLQRLEPRHTLFERLAGLEFRQVPSGLVHGDLAWGNLIRGFDGRIHLIDWDRCERQSPRLLDTVHACHSLARTHHFLAYPESTADRILEAWEWLFDRNPDLPLLEHVDDVRGELSWKEAVGLTLLNEIDQHHRTLRENPILRNAHHDKLRERFLLALRHLGGDE